MLLVAGRGLKSCTIPVPEKYHPVIIEHFFMVTWWRWNIAELDGRLSVLFYSFFVTLEHGKTERPLTKIKSDSCLHYCTLNLKQLVVQLWRSVCRCGKRTPFGTYGGKLANFTQLIFRKLPFVQHLQLEMLNLEWLMLSLLEMLCK